MKKQILFSGALFLFFSLCFAQNSLQTSKTAAAEKNLILKENFLAEEIEVLDFDLSFENVTFGQIYGDEILVEIYSNNKIKLPTVSLQNEQFCMKSTMLPVEKADNCSIFIYIPQNKVFSQTKIKTQNGKIRIENLEAQELEICTENGSQEIINFTGETFSLNSQSGNIMTRNLNAEYFDACTTSGTLTIDLQKTPVATSRLNSESGNINLYLSQNLQVKINAFTNSGSVKNKVPQAADGENAAEIVIYSKSGDIRVER